MSGLHFDSQKKKQQGKPDAGKPHVRFDEGGGFSSILGGNLSTLKTLLLGSLLHKFLRRTS